MKKAAIVLSLCLLFTSVGVGQDEELLDLITLKAAKASQAHDEPTTGGGSASGDSGERPQCPVKLTLARVDKPVYQIGDEIVYEAIVENVSQEKVLLPASLDGSDAEFAASARYLANYSAYSRVYLSLEAENTETYPQIFVNDVLYGAEPRPGSFRILSPGQKLRIRTSGLVRFINSGFFEKFASELPKKCEVRVSLTLFHFRNRVAGFTQQFDEPAVSANSVTIELRKYEPPDQSPSQ
jgi:hypothetical protein